MPFAMPGLHARGLDTFWIATHRRDAQQHLRDARDSEFRAEWHFESALRELQAGDERAATEWIAHAFRVLESASFFRKLARASALMAVRGTPLESWTAARRRAWREELEARRRRFEA